MRNPLHVVGASLLIATLANFVAVTPAWAQPLSGNYTINNAQPGSGTNFVSLGSAFDALEANGISAAVTFDMFDDGGDYATDLTYGLGVSDNGLFDAQVAGMGTFPLVFRAAFGESPVVTGALFQTGVNGDVVTCYINCPNNVTIEGITFSGGDTACLYCDCLYQPLTSINALTIRRCTFRNCSGGPGLAVRNVTGTAMTNVTIENNFLYGNAGDGSSGQIDNDCLASLGVIGYSASVVVRHNTVLHTSINANTGAIGMRDDPPSTPMGNMSFNIFIVTAGGNFCINDRNGNGSPPLAANRNVYHSFPGALFHRNTPLYPNFNTWRTLTGLDANSVTNNPNLVNINPGSEDLHLTAASANSLHQASGSTTALDRDGDTRPFGPGRDIGADEHTFGALPEIDVQGPGAVAVADGGTSAQGTVGIGVAHDRTFLIVNSGLVNLNLTGTTPVMTSNDANVTSTVLTQPGLLVVPPSGTTTFVVRYTVTAAAAFSFDIDIASDDSDENPYDILVSGTGTAGPVILVQRPAGSTIANGATDGVGVVAAGMTVTLTFTIVNQGAAVLNLNGAPAVQINTLNNCTATVTAQPTTPVAVLGTTTFNIDITPSAAGTFGVSISVPNDDPASNPYVVNVFGSGTTPPSSGGCAISADPANPANQLPAAMLALGLALLVLARRRVVAL